MRTGLFVPCFVDQFYPQVAIAALQFLEKTGCKVEYVRDQTCCGQPLANSGFEKESAGAARTFIRNFSEFDSIVSLSASCTHHVKHHFDFIAQDEEVTHVRRNIYELSEFISRKIDQELPEVYFPHRVGLHQSCHGLRGLRLASGSERVVNPFNTVADLLKKVKGLQLVDLARPDECCGFGGTFAVKEEAVSVMMGNDRLTDHINSGAEFITGADVSCLMHLDGLISRQRLDLRTVHFVEILNDSVK
jgi:L-lactate dehydrogenase complex protein LldE